MNAMPGMSRRGFLGATARVGGTVLLSLSLPGWATAGKRQGAAAAAQLNAWLVIDADNTVSVIVDRCEMGQGVYTALPMLLAEELHVRFEAIKVIAAPVADVYVSPGNGGQITGTSNSVQESWDKLRLAGAQARTLLIAAAADAWRVDAAACRAHDGIITGPAGKTLTYGAVAAAAAKLPIPHDVPLKSSQQFKLIGKPRRRLDSPGKVDGTAQFGIDVKLPGMLHAALAQSPVLGGKMTALDAAAAEAMPGVRKVLVVDSGVAVVAEHYWQALQARKQLKITWDPGANAGLDTASMYQLLETAAKTDPSLSARADGDAPAVLGKAANLLQAVYELPLLAHATMEPMNCTADVTAHGCDLYVGTQVPQVAQTTAAAVAGVEPSQVRVFTTLLGGGFGRRLDVDFIPAAVAASKALGVPVKLIWTREDDMSHGTYRPPAREAITAALDGAGRLIAWSLHITSPSITARMFPPVKGVDDSVIEAAVNCPYAVPNYSLTYTRREIGVDVAYMRSVSHAANCFAIESFMDEAAHAAGKDPIEFRLSLLEQKPREQRVIRLAAERAKWGNTAPGRFHGVAFMAGYGTPLAQIVEISVDDRQLKVHRITCVVDCGQMVNPRIVESQIVSGIIFGLTSALWGDITLVGGEVQEKNFNTYRVLRGNEVPVLDVHLLDSDAPPGGIGEPGVPPVAPALCNAIFAATGQRIRRLPVTAQGLFKA
jgi:isoquinoline 1-oxidoreductase beta subunit